MKKKYISLVLFFSFVLFLAGCQSTETTKGVTTDMDRLNEFTIEDRTFESTPLIQVVNYLRTEINKQSEQEWVIQIRQNEGDPRSFSDYEIENAYRFSANFISKVGIGIVLEFYARNNQIHYEVEGNVITISKMVHGF